MKRYAPVLLLLLARGAALRAGMLVELDASAADALTVRDNELTCNHASTLGHADRDALQADGYFLDQEWSPCVDAGRDTAAAAGLGGWSTAADGRADDGRADLGYHHAPAAVLPAAGWGLF